MLFLLTILLACQKSQPPASPQIPLLPENIITETVDSNPDLSPEYPDCPDFIQGQMFSAFIWPEEKKELRVGAAEHRLGNTGTTKEGAIEVCSPNHQQKWIEEASCPAAFDQPGGQAPARYQRRASVGSGGRCGKIIDEYEVVCQYGEQSKSFILYMDMYHCTPEECNSDLSAPCPE